MDKWQDFANKAHTVPFVPKGRGYSGWDCWGLIVCAYRDVVGTEIPNYLEIYDDTRNVRKLAEAFKKRFTDDWKQCDRALGSIALIRRKFQRVHVGLVVTKRHILHTEEVIGTIVQEDKHLTIESFWVPA